ncbi:LysR family transcriptional regulator [Klebsiella pneumoniae]|uniref:LysR family transcriptional regulator n=1 Tax=Klebsiella pneumoniae TaxID=573 RepID=A0A378BEM7_KLEPN|nr:LysR family transcriptional regulator [Klebsiella pneumoniae]
MLNLQRVTMFIAVVDAGSFTLAAAALGQTKAVVSFNVRQLENELGVTLLLRSTRRLRLTDAGVLFYQRGVALLNAAENLQDEVRASHSGLSGSYGSPPRRSMASRLSFQRWPRSPVVIRRCGCATSPSSHHADLHFRTI